MKHTFTHLAVLLLAPLVALHAAAATAGEELQKPPQVWADYDPDQGDFKQEIVK